MRLRIAPTADADLDEIWLFLARKTGNLDFATQVVDSISEKFALFVRFPFMGRRHAGNNSGDMRSFPIDDYIIFYRVRRGEVQIVRVLHGSRNAEATFTEEESAD